MHGLVQTIRGRRVLALDAWQVPAGGRALVVGPSGSGKTTLLHLIAGLRRPTQGQVHVAGQSLGRLRGGRLDRWRAARIGIVFQTLHLVGALNVLGNLRLAAFLSGRRVRDAELRALLARIGLEGRAGARVHELSQGEAQRVAIARAVVNRPALLLADEPTSALDDHHCGRVLDLLDAVASASGAALIVATHDRRLEPYFADRLHLGLDP